MSETLNPDSTATRTFKPRLGRLPARHDPRTLRLASYLRPEALPPAPRQISWAPPGVSWPVMQNDQVGDCTIAAAGHMIECWTGDTRRTASGLPYPQIVPDAEIIAAYSAVCGYDPKTGVNDNGAVVLDVLNYWRKTGIGGHTIEAFVSIDPQNLDHCRLATFLFGGLYLGLSLPATAQGSIGDEWSVTPRWRWRAADNPGSWGGHAVPVVAYDPWHVWVVTWGQIQAMTWGFFNLYCEEAWAVLSPDWFAGAKAPSGFDLAALRSDLAALGSGL